MTLKRDDGDGGTHLEAGGHSDPCAEKDWAGRIDYKAVLTPTNQSWNALTLYGELAKEHAKMNR